MKNVKLMLFVAILGLFSWDISSAKAGPGDGGGDFGYGTETLEIVKKQVIDCLSSLPADIVAVFVKKNPPTLDEINVLRGTVPGFEPASVEQASLPFLISVIQNIRENRDKADMQGKFMLFGGNPTDGHYIETLQAFYIGYGTKPFGDQDQATKLEIARKLIHETSHLWGYADNKAFQFSTYIINNLFHEGRKFFAQETIKITALQSPMQISEASQSICEYKGTEWEKKICGLMITSDLSNCIRNATRVPYKEIRNHRIMGPFTYLNGDWNRLYDHKYMSTDDAEWFCLAPPSKRDCYWNLIPTYDSLKKGELRSKLDMLCDGK